MPLVLDGTNGVSGVDGTASNPSYEGTDSNTGIFYPAADTVAIGTGGVQRVTADSSGNLRLNTSTGELQLAVGAERTITPSGSSGSTALTFKRWNGSSYVNDVVMDASGRLLVGTTTAIGSWGSAKSQELQIAASGAAYPGLSAYAFSTNAGAGGMINLGRSRSTTVGTMTATQSGDVLGYLIFEGVNSSNALVGGAYISVAQSGAAGASYVPAEIRFFTSDATNGNTDRVRITSGGYFKASNAGAYVSSTGSYHEFNTDFSGEWSLRTRHTHTSNPYGIAIQYSGAAPNGTGNEFLYVYDNAALRASIRSNGGLANYSANNVNLSDRREKTNFAPAKNYLDVICAIPVQTFNYIDQNMEEDPGETLGVVAQDVQAVAPEMVMESNWGTAEEPKMRLSIYQTDLQYALMKSIQELKAIVDAQAAEIAALKAQP